MKRINANEIAIIVLIFVAILLGTFLRVSVVLMDDFPRNDGGLFWAMTRDLVNNHFALPRYTTYNQDSIPFAYPPAAFYIIGFLNHFFQISLVSLFRFFPLICNILVLFLIYPITNLVLQSKPQALFALYAYAIILPSYDWLLMGGGVTRALGQLFATLAIFATLAGAISHKRRWLFLSVFSIVIAGYSHIEIAWRAAILMVFLFYLVDRTQRTIWFVLIHLGSGIILLSPYWLTILLKHGAGPFIYAFQSGNTAALTTLGLIFVPNYTAEPYFQVLAVLGFLGIFASLASRQYIPVLWLVLVILTDPRSLHRSAALPEAMLIAISLDVFIIQGLGNIERNLSDQVKHPHLRVRPRFRLPIPFPYATAAILILYAFLLAVASFPSFRTSNALSQSEQEAFSWSADHTRQDAKFLIFPASSSWVNDWISEWFPALSLRQNILTVQGYEWTESLYGLRQEIYFELVKCLRSNSPCYKAWLAKYHLSCDYLLIPRRSELIAKKLIDSDVLSFQGMLDGCTLAYQNNDIDIYKCSK